MPYVNIRIAGTLTREQKAGIAAEITDTLVGWNPAPNDH